MRTQWGQCQGCRFPTARHHARILRVPHREPRTADRLRAARCRRYTAWSAARLVGRISVTRVKVVYRLPYWSRSRYLVPYTGTGIPVIPVGRYRYGTGTSQYIPGTTIYSYIVKLYRTTAPVRALYVRYMYTVYT